MMGVIFTQLFKGIAFGWITGTIESYSKRLLFAFMTVLIAVLVIGIFAVGTEEIASSGGWGWMYMVPLIVGVWVGEASAKIAYREAFA